MAPCTLAAIAVLQLRQALLKQPDRTLDMPIVSSYG